MVIFVLQCCLTLSSDTWVVSKYLIIFFYYMAEERGSGAVPAIVLQYDNPEMIHFEDL